MHVFLIKQYCVPHTEIFISVLLDIVSFELYDPVDFLVKNFDLEENAPINQLFDTVGYERSDFVLNMGFMFLIMLVIPLLLMTIVICSYMCSGMPKCRAFCRRQSKKTFCNRLLMVIETTMMFIITCAIINIYQV